MFDAISLSGGGSHGAYQAGVLFGLSQNRVLTPKIFGGTSVGALNTALLASRADLRSAALELRKVWMDLAESDVFRPWWPRWLGPLRYLPAIWEGSALNTKPLRDLLAALYEPGAPAKAGHRLRIPAVSLNSGEMRVWNERTTDWKALYASSANPLFEPIEIDGELYVDGGVRDITPLGQVIDAGGREVLVVHTMPKQLGPWEDGGFKLMHRLGRQIDILLNEIQTNDLRQCQRINRQVKAGLADPRHRVVRVTVFRPSRPLAGTSNEFDAAAIRDNFDLGVEDSEHGGEYLT